MSDVGLVSSKSFLICRSGQRSCGFPLPHVIEAMRPLPVEPLPEMPSFIAGVSIIRGAAVPVVNLADLLGDMADSEITRFVSLKAGGRTVAFAVGSVIGVGELTIDGKNTVNELPPLLGEVDSGIVKTIGIRDADLFSVLEASRLIPESLWQHLEEQGVVI